MEMGPLQSGEVIALKARMRTMEEQLKRASGAVSTAAKRYPPVPLETNLNPNATLYTGPIVARPKSDCYECQELGHFGRDCPIRKARLEREAAYSRTVLALVDTGASLSLLRGDVTRDIMQK